MAQAPQADFRDAASSEDARFAAQWVMHAADHQGLPFAVVDKRDARLYVFTADGRLLGASAALLGAAVGDHSAPGVGQRAQKRGLPLDERTTPAGRFASEPGRNLTGEDIVWIDYDAAVAIHRLRPADPRERRPERLASTSPADNRISAGCVVVPIAFYEQVVRPSLGRSRGVVYVLPETRPAGDLFRALSRATEPWSDPS